MVRCSNSVRHRKRKRLVWVCSDFVVYLLKIARLALFDIDRYYVYNKKYEYQYEDRLVALVGFIYAGSCRRGDINKSDYIKLD